MIFIPSRKIQVPLSKESDLHTKIMYKKMKLGKIVYSFPKLANAYLHIYIYIVIIIIQLCNRIHKRTIVVYIYYKLALATQL
jgi:hypothetical protein